MQSLYFLACSGFKLQRLEVSEPEDLQPTRPTTDSSELKVLPVFCEVEKVMKGFFYCQMV